MEFPDELWELNSLSILILGLLGKKGSLCKDEIAIELRKPRNTVGDALRPLIVHHLIRQVPLKVNLTGRPIFFYEVIPERYDAFQIAWNTKWNVGEKE